MTVSPVLQSLPTVAIVILPITRAILVDPPSTGLLKVQDAIHVHPLSRSANYAHPLVI